MKRFNIPRGAQTWECPLYEPDILAAAFAVGAYVEAYEITKDDHHLGRAEYWAKTGLPFLYHWNLTDRPGMRFASIPVFGTTFHTHSWFGVPVQWCGLGVCVLPPAPRPPQRRASVATDCRRHHDQWNVPTMDRRRAQRNVSRWLLRVLHRGTWTTSQPRRHHGKSLRPARA